MLFRSQVRERLFVQKKQSYRLCYDESCQVEIGKELAANKSLSTRILKLGGRCVLVLNLYDLSSATLDRATSVEGGCQEDALASMVRRASAELAARAAPRRPAARKVPG